MKESKKLRIINQVMERVMTQKEAAKLLGVSDRQIRNIINKVKIYGEDGIRHLNRFNKPAHSFSEQFKQEIIVLFNNEKTKNLTFTSFMKHLEKRGITLSYASLYNILTQNGIKSPKRHVRKRGVNYIKSKEQFGELIHVKLWRAKLFDTEDEFTLLGFIDEASGKIIGVYMCKNECLLGYLEITRQMISMYGSPQTICSDHGSPFYQEDNVKDESRSFRYYHKILDELGIEIALPEEDNEKRYSSKVWEILMKRINEELKRHMFDSIEKINSFLAEYIKGFNRNFELKAGLKQSLFVKPPEYVDVELLLSVKLMKTVENSGVISINRKKFKILENDIPEKSFVKVYISHRIGINVEHNGKRYAVVPFKEERFGQKSGLNQEVMNFAVEYCMAN